MGLRNPCKSPEANRPGSAPEDEAAEPPTVRRRMGSEHDPSTGDAPRMPAPSVQLHYASSRPAGARPTQSREGIVSDRPESLHEAAAAKGIRYLLFSFTDLFGIMRSKLVPAAAIRDMESDGAGFGGFAVWLEMTPAHPDILAVPDASSLMQLPWDPSIGWVASDIHMAGQLVQQAPRVALRRALDRAHADGFRLRHGVECEFFLMSPDGTAISDPLDRQAKPCYDTAALMRRSGLITEVCDAMETLGWGPYQNDHEDGCGQFEMNWNYADALVTADRHAFFKFMVRSIAERHGLRATFMPKPFPDLTGNGCHAHLSLWDAAGATNLFHDDADDLGLSETAHRFLGGLLHHAKGLTAVLNPSVNSYKRLNAPPTASGATWSPNRATWSGNNRTHMVRVPGPGRMELRLGDGAANPYLLPLAVLAAGLHGVADRMSPGERRDYDLYADPERAAEEPDLPRNLLDALRALQQDRRLCGDMGDEVSEAFLKLKFADWRDFAASLSDWEREHTLDI